MYIASDPAIKFRTLVKPFVQPEVAGDFSSAGFAFESFWVDTEQRCSLFAGKPRLRCAIYCVRDG